MKQTELLAEANRWAAEAICAEKAFGAHSFGTHANRTLAHYEHLRDQAVEKLREQGLKVRVKPSYSGCTDNAVVVEA